MTELIEHNIFLVLFLPVWVCLFILVNHFVKFTDTKKLTYFFTLFSTTVGLIFSSFLLYSTLFPVQRTIENSLLWFQYGNLSVYFGVFIDNISAIFLFILMCVSLAVHIFSYDYMKDDEDFHKYFFYLNFFNFSMSALLVSSNLIQTYIFWELVGVASYLLIGFWYKRADVSLAAKKVFWINRIGDFTFLLALITLIYYSVSYLQSFPQGEILAFTNLDAITFNLQALMSETTFVSILLLLALSAFVKSAQFPFQTWLVDAMKAPTPVSALIHSATMVCAGLFLILRLYPMFMASEFILHLIFIVGLFTAIFCALFALPQRNIKKMLAYSTSSQLGLMFFALGALSPTAAIFYMCAHAFAKSSLFLTTGYVSKLYGDELNMNKLGGVRYNKFLLALYWFIASVSLSGMAFIGRNAKEAIYGSFFNPSSYLTLSLLVLVSFLTTVYLFRSYLKIFEFESNLSMKYMSSYSMTFGILGVVLLSLCGGAIINNELLKAITPQNFFFTEYHDLGLALILIAAALIGISVAFITVKIKPKRNIIPRFIVKFFYRGAYIDSIFKFIGSILFISVCKVLKFIDEYIFDGCVKLISFISVKLSHLVKKLQNGNFQTYIAYAVFSAGLILYLAFQIYSYIAKEL
ncbi:hypothetical protein IKQ26_08780 [bacterium]|nr:hypothetical protein [bacterium]